VNHKLLLPASSGCPETCCPRRCFRSEALKINPIKARFATNPFLPVFPGFPAASSSLSLNSPAAAQTHFPGRSPCAPHRRPNKPSPPLFFYLFFLDAALSWTFFFLLLGRVVPSFQVISEVAAAYTLHVQEAGLVLPSLRVSDRGSRSFFLDSSFAAFAATVPVFAFLPIDRIVLFTAYPARARARSLFRGFFRRTEV